MSTQFEAVSETAGVEAVRGRIREEGVLARPLRRVFALMAQQPRSLQELVRVCRAPRRTVEELIGLAGEDVESGPEGYRLAERALPLYRERVLLAESDGGPEEVEQLLERFVATGPAPAAALDHVTATPGTALRRARWLRDHYELDGARLLLLGDHDLTSLAGCLLVPGLRATVVDIDERVLAHIDGTAAEHGLDVHTVHADLRFGLPPSLNAGFDLVFTDPPYTPEGVGLFGTRALEAMSSSTSRLLLAYGFSSRSPALGHKVQQELLRLGFVFESIVAGLNEYEGAQAIGSTSDLYVCQPTGRARKSAGRQKQTIYTHGPQSVEGTTGETSPELLEGIGAVTGTPVRSLRPVGWQRPLRATDEVAVFDLRGDPGPWLLRMLLACNTEKVAFLVDNRHPDITSEHAQHALAHVVGAKYALRFHRSSPDATHAVVVATTNGATGGIAGYLLHRAHGKIANTWREALIAHSETQLTKREAAEHVAALVADTADLGLRLIDLPRHRLSALLHSEGV
ncbi:MULTISPECIES: bis-aminopropyl spermidine synthase family protein [Actinopolyspora]|uniref:Predicted methyltransferase n=1 Tax=Actinopolyspora saharensis TaxID=995062 RepID=A0A1H1E5D8_9ACTN|nr:MULTISPECIES: bis-aminopropyl spermidine synthase family protein [Actinopolyspora]NHD18616.1 bis-aminopropyl spermidine synthase family protein [Actinopolyspora sp. BKK2]NHE78062.1 bis-aminopropyl spermidine synthase family protein [Actinopolyspora sp. BKK1]SDQ83917.1 Predicted methyltransferase [Actinopolyspora saharensis]